MRRYGEEPGGARGALGVLRPLYAESQSLPLPGREERGAAQNCRHFLFRASIVDLPERTGGCGRTLSQQNGSAKPVGTWACNLPAKIKMQLKRLVTLPLLSERLPRFSGFSFISSFPRC